jgi:hypothetical protein
MNTHQPSPFQEKARARESLQVIAGFFHLTPCHMKLGKSSSHQLLCQMSVTENYVGICEKRNKAKKKV